MKPHLRLRIWYFQYKGDQPEKVVSWECRSDVGIAWGNTPMEAYSEMERQRVRRAVREARAKHFLGRIWNRWLDFWWLD